jgi:uncharacterized membrane protein
VSVDVRAHMSVWPIAHVGVGAVAVLAFRSMDISSSSILHGAVLPLTFWVSVVYFLVVVALLIGRAIGGGSNADAGSVSAALSDMASSGGGSEGDSSDN